MGNFILTVSAESLSTQIAQLVNLGGQVRMLISPDSVLHGPTRYLIELDGEKVIGVIGLGKHRLNVTELKHLCVHPDYRRRGLGKKLLEKGIEATDTEFVYGKVRSDNVVNIRNNLRVGMRPLFKQVHKNYSIITFGKRKVWRHANGC